MRVVSYRPSVAAVLEIEHDRTIIGNNNAAYLVIDRKNTLSESIPTVTAFDFLIFIGILKISSGNRCE